MRLHCTECGKSVSSEVPKDTIVRAWLICPECIEKMMGPELEAALQKLKTKETK